MNITVKAKNDMGVGMRLPADGPVIIEFLSQDGHSTVYQVDIFNEEVLGFVHSSDTLDPVITLNLTPEELQNLIDQTEDNVAEHRSWSDTYRYKHSQDWHNLRADILAGIERKARSLAERARKA